jgi:hypothetical protein
MLSLEELLPPSDGNELEESADCDCSPSAPPAPPPPALGAPVLGCGMPAAVAPPEAPGCGIPSVGCDAPPLPPDDPPELLPL